MSTSEERALVTEIQDRLIELWVEQDEARRAKDRDRARDRQDHSAAGGDPPLKRLGSR
jgi:hypothetical protein